MDIFNRLRQWLMKSFFNQLYHSLAWGYDGVAAFVSFGKWHEWGKSVLPFVKGKSVLELGYGTGHLQKALNEAGFVVFGVDESWQMARLARRRVAGGRLIRGCGQFLPFPGNAFDCVVAVFPAPYLFETATLAEIQRVLRGDGKLVVLPAAWIVGRGLAGRFWAWIYRITGESPDLNSEIVAEIAERFSHLGFVIQVTWIEENGARLMIVQGDRNHFVVG